MSNASSSFFVTGGTLRPDAACYVERQADKDLYDGLTAGDFCYVLTSRQMGKSSLMVRTVQRLRADGRAVAVLDLTAIGQNLTVDQWYTGLLERAGSQLDLEDEFEDFYEDNANLGPAQRWFAAIREVALASKDCEKGLVIFVDEIDAVRSLPFSTDEFFAAIRECFNSRSAEPELAKLTFCLLGVATPSDLIRDTRTTPFNIGRRIELRDFSKTEAEGLVGGLEAHFPTDKAKVFLDRVMYWTNGQPYLTQLFCRSLAENTDVATIAKVDRLCETLFLDERAAEKNDNLVFVRERMLRSEVDRFELLNLYAKIHQGRCVRDDPGNPLVGVLRLSGIAREEKGYLQIRSPIYSRVFDCNWVRHNLPDAEVRRQQKAYRQGVIRSGVWALCILAVIAHFWIKAHEQAMRADQSALSEASARGAAELAQKKAEVAAQQVSEVLSQMELRQAEEMFRLGRSSTAVAYLAHLLNSNPTNRLAAQRLVYALSQRNFAIPIHEQERSAGDQPFVPRPSAPEFRVEIQRTNETVALVYRRRSSSPIARLQHDGYIIESDISPDSRFIATAAMDDTARLWNAETGELLTAPLKHDGPVTTAKFSPDGRLLATAAADHTVRIWEVETGRLINEPLMHRGSVGSIQFDQSGSRLFTRMRRGRGRNRSPFRLWDLRPGNLRAPALSHESSVLFVRSVGDEGLVLTVAKDNVVRLWNADSGQPSGASLQVEGDLFRLEVSPTGESFMTVDRAGTAMLWSLPAMQPLRQLSETGEPVASVRFSSTGDRILVAHVAGRVTIASADDTGTNVVLETPTRIVRAEFDQGSKRVLTIGVGRTVRIWSAADGKLLADGIGHFGPIFGARFSPDTHRLVTWSMNSARLWSTAEEATPEMPLEHGSIIRHAGFDRTGERVFTASMDRTVRIWNTLTGEPLGLPLVHSASVVHAQVLGDNLRLLSTTSTHRSRLWDLQTGQPISEAFAAAHHHVYGGVRFEPHQTTSLSPDGRWLATTTDDTTVRVWPVLDPPVPVPNWLPMLAEQIGGERINERGAIVSTDGRELRQIRKNLSRWDDEAFYIRWGKWLLADRADRPLFPGSVVRNSDLTAVDHAQHEQPQK